MSVTCAGRGEAGAHRLHAAIHPAPRCSSASPGVLLVTWHLLLTRHLLRHASQKLAPQQTLAAARARWEGLDAICAHGCGERGRDANQRAEDGGDGAPVTSAQASAWRRASLPKASRAAISEQTVFLRYLDGNLDILILGHLAVGLIISGGGASKEFSEIFNPPRHLTIGGYPNLLG